MVVTFDKEQIYMVVNASRVPLQAKAKAQSCYNTNQLLGHQQKVHRLKQHSMHMHWGGAFSMGP